ncbi:MAG: heavy-metal-associated domain-containing protein [Actinobacteria bacterium]|nr:heavy-metal-associated domain-containing protein [Actinomycetota bacterium]
MGETERSYEVEGMTCHSCVAMVTEEVSEVPGVVSVDVDLPSGRVTVAGDADDDAVRRAIVEAGYSVA